MELSKAARIFKALSCEQRLRVLKILTDNYDRNSCCDGVDKAFSLACETLNVSQSTVSHHFKELENAGLISCSRKGQSVCCKINEELILDIKKVL